MIPHGPDVKARSFPIARLPAAFVVQASEAPVKTGME